MKKRVFSMFLCLCMAFTLVGAVVPTAKAATSGPDELKVTITDDNPYLSGKAGLKTITEKAKNDNGTLRCTVYVWQRVLEEYGIKLPDWTVDCGGGNIRRDAYLWYEGAQKEEAQKLGIKVGDTPRPKSIVVYEGGGSGHVALVRKVDETKNTMTVEEAGISRVNNRDGIQSIDIGKANKGDTRQGWANYKVLGYIYLPVPPAPPLTSPAPLRHPKAPSGRFGFSGTHPVARQVMRLSPGCSQ